MRAEVEEHTDCDDGREIKDKNDRNQSNFDSNHECRATIVQRIRCAAFRFEHATARAAYPRNPCAMRSCLRICLEAHVRVCAVR